MTNPFTNTEPLRNLRIVKKGLTGKRKYIVINVSGKTKLDLIAKKYSKSYYVGFGSWDAGRKRMVLYKRDKPLIKTISSWYEWGGR